ncbi:MULTISPECIES: biotin-dependent carboxyltransferase family protein [unclassified Sporosarcina]|uniref:5-oxoprolinase subunit C family protein n=1 Tax=unclassified Sporosarcina TaxID=2647733 RepID=UPI001E54C752|nr:MULTISPECIES: biotin-dependent carboxyltransferase family protein [unclassified Sporosarcina]
MESQLEYVNILKPGLLTTVQDLGRRDYRIYGVSVSGVMDPLSFRLANTLVGNHENDAAIEITMMGPTIKFETKTAFSITGGNLSPKLNGKSIDMWKVIFAKAGDELSFGKYISGCRSYIALAGGVNVPVVMGSRATFTRGHYGGYMGRALKRGDKLYFNKPDFNIKQLQGRRLRTNDIPDFGEERPIRFILGPHIERFVNKSIETFSNGTYSLSNASDRMGYRLEGEQLIHKDGADIISDFITPGTIQVPGNGYPIIHMADCGTSGGYTKIGVVITTDIPYVAQKKPGDKIKFQVCDINEAQNEYRKIEKMLYDIELNNKLLSRN